MARSAACRRKSGRSWRRRGRRPWARRDGFRGGRRRRSPRCSAISGGVRAGARRRNDRAPLTAEEFAAAVVVSRETMARLTAYAALLERWQRRINLVAADSLSDLWRRHMLDSAQLLPLIPSPPATVLDIGSGAGFPG